MTHTERDQALRAYLQHKPECHTRRNGWRWEPNYKRSGKRWYGAWGPDPTAQHACTCGLDALLAADPPAPQVETPQEDDADIERRDIQALIDGLRTDARIERLAISPEKPDYVRGRADGIATGMEAAAERFAGLLDALSRVETPQEDGWSKWLKDGETPLERIEREHRDNQTLLGLLAREKSAHERTTAALRLMLECYEKHERWCGNKKDAPGDSIHWQARDAARKALTPREPDPPAPSPARETEAERTVRSIAAMLGWGNVPPRETLERDIAALKARARAPKKGQPE